MPRLGTNAPIKSDNWLGPCLDDAVHTVSLNCSLEDEVNPAPLYPNAACRLDEQSKPHLSRLLNHQLTKGLA